MSDEPKAAPKPRRKVESVPTVFPQMTTVVTQDGSKIKDVPFVSLRFSNPQDWIKRRDSMTLKPDTVIAYSSTDPEFNAGIHMSYERAKKTGEKHHMYAIRTASFEFVLDTQSMRLGLYVRKGSPFAKMYATKLGNEDDTDLLFVVPFHCWMFVRLTIATYGLLMPADYDRFGTARDLTLNIGDKSYEVTGFFNLKTAYPDLKQKQLLKLFRKMHYAYVKHVIGTPLKYKYKHTFEIYLMHVLEIARPDYTLENPTQPAPLQPQVPVPAGAAPVTPLKAAASTGAAAAKGPRRVALVSVTAMDRALAQPLNLKPPTPGGMWDSPQQPQSAVEMMRADLEEIRRQAAVQRAMARLRVGPSSPAVQKSPAEDAAKDEENIEGQQEESEYEDEDNESNLSFVDSDEEEGTEEDYYILEQMKLITAAFGGVEREETKAARARLAQEPLKDAPAASSLKPRPKGP